MFFKNKKIISVFLCFFLSGFSTLEDQSFQGVVNHCVYEILKKTIPTVESFKERVFCAANDLRHAECKRGYDDFVLVEPNRSVKLETQIPQDDLSRWVNAVREDFIRNNKEFTFANKKRLSKKDIIAFHAIINKLICKIITICFVAENFDNENDSILQQIQGLFFGYKGLDEKKAKLSILQEEWANFEQEITTFFKKFDLNLSNKTFKSQELFLALAKINQLFSFNENNFLYFDGLIKRAQNGQIGHPKLSAQWQDKFEKAI